MARQRTIVGVGEAVLSEHGDHAAPSGLASDVALAAVRLGQRGVVVARVGQDDAARELLDAYRAAGVDATHVQSDPDLPTARVTVRAIGPPVERYLEASAAFDNLQWDFDLEDVAQEADAVVFGMLTRRSGQARSEENRLVDASAAALKIFDLTNAAGDVIDRGHAVSGLELAEGAVVDVRALDAVSPGWRGSPPADAIADLRRAHGLSLVIFTEPADGRTRLAIHADDAEDRSIVIGDGRAITVAAVVAFIVCVLRGRPLGEALDAASRVAEHAEKEPSAPFPVDVLR